MLMNILDCTGGDVTPSFKKEPLIQCQNIRENVNN